MSRTNCRDREQETASQSNLGLDDSYPSLRPAPASWLEDALVKLQRVSNELNRAASPDEVMRLAVTVGRESLGFQRLGIWLFEPSLHSLTGTYGVNEKGEIVDERRFRIFDRGSVAPQLEAWSRPPYYFLRADDNLRDSEGGTIARGVHFTVPLLHDGQTKGLVSVDDLIDGPAVNDKTGLLLTLFSNCVASHYFLKVAERQTRVAVAASERADAIKREFLGMLSHEVRTPLNAILGFAQLLCMDSEDPEQAQLAKTIEESGDHLLELLSSMMDYANLADEDLRQRFAPCSPIEIARETVDSFTEIAKRKGLSVHFAHKGDFSGLALADPIGLRQVLSNLVQNAVKFTDSGSIRVLAQSQPKPDGAVAFLISVEDTGCGIGEQDRALIFQPFKQIDSSLTRVHGGIGMGLAIVERLVTAMGGHVTCDSQPGKGTRFLIDFVFDYASKAPAIIAHGIGTRFPSAKDRSQLKLLIAEDNEHNRLVLLSFLKRLGYSEPEQALDGESARLLIAQRPYDLLILDLEMPKLDGLALTRMVREGHCGPINADVPIVGATAHNFKYDRDRSIAAGMNNYLSKPFRAEELDLTISQLVKA